MLRHILLPTMFVILGFGFWTSPDFKEIAAGVAIFLFGMLFLEEGFKAFTGGLLEKILKRTTDRFWKALSFGVVSTTIMQSSSLVSVITISFLSAGLIPLMAGMGIIFGANLGTTTGAWLVAGLGLKVKISAYAMPMLVFGIILVFQSSRNLKGIGYVLAGLGFLFLGIHHMKEGFEAFRGSIDLAQYAMTGLGGLLFFSLVGAVATVVMQSSHATLVLIITALAAGQVTYENALALAIGANVGTTITAIIGALSANYQGKRLAGAHLIFNVMTGLIAIVFMGQFVLAVEWVSELVHIPSDDYALKLAVFHTIFNVVGVAVMTPLASATEKFLTRLIKQPAEDLIQPKYLNAASMEFPETVYKAVWNESLHLYDNAFEIIAHGLSLHRHDILSEDDLEQVIRRNRKVIELDIDDVYERKVKVLYAAILEYISQAQTTLPSSAAEGLFDLRQACTEIVQAVKDVKHLRKNICKYMDSDTPAVRDEYDHLRREIAGVLRKMYELRNLEEDSDEGILALDEFKLSISESEIIDNGKLDELMGKRQISARVGSSLMNDIGYAKHAIWNIISFGTTVFGAKDLDDKIVEHLLALTDDDIEAIHDENLAEQDAANKPA